MEMLSGNVGKKNSRRSCESRHSCRDDDDDDDDDDAKSERERERERKHNT